MFRNNQRCLQCIRTISSAGRTYSSTINQHLPKVSVVERIHDAGGDDNHRLKQDGSSHSTINVAKISARKQFEQIPIHPSILTYIRSIGVGIAPRQPSGRRHRRIAPTYSEHKDGGHRLRPRGRSLNSRQRKETLLQTKDVEETKNSKINDVKKVVYNADWSWMPPPPFGPKSFPVELIGSVGPEVVTQTDSSLPSQSDSISFTEQSYQRMKHSFPKNQSLIPEIAFAGRSNVGKSTLLNALLYGNRDGNNAIRSRHKQHGRVPNNMKIPKGIKAITSAKPGETRRISFYKIQHEERIKNDDTPESVDVIEKRRLLLVDLPGYGFAYAKQSDSAAYRALMCEYLLQRGKTLKRLLLLIDARHGMKKADIDFLSMLEQHHISHVQSNTDTATGRNNYTLPFPIQLVLTKCDLVSQTDIARRVTQVRQQLLNTLRREPGQLPVMMVSARAGVGFNNVDLFQNKARGGVLELQKELAALAHPLIRSQK